MIMSKLTLRFRVHRRTVAFMTAAALLAGAGVARFVSINAAAQQANRDQSSVIVNVEPSAKTAPVQKLHKHRWYQLGIASWYGRAFQGRTTASGENFDMNDMTAAHRNLPLGTLLRVTNLNNHRNVIVRVNDRGPVPEDRIIDLSYAAAQRLSFEERGLAQVKLEVLPPTAENVAHLTAPALPQAR